MATMLRWGYIWISWHLGALTHQINSRRFCLTQFFQNSLNKFKSYLAFQTTNQVVKKWKPQKNTSSLLFYISFSFRTPWFLKKSCLIWRFFRDHCNGSEWHDRKINMKEIFYQMVCHGSGPYSSQFWNLKFKLRVFGIPMGILQLTKVLQWFATHFWRYRSKSGVSVWEITLEIAHARTEMPRIYLVWICISPLVWMKISK